MPNHARQEPHSVARRGRSGSVLLAVVLGTLSACNDGIPLRNSPADSLLTVRYVELLRAEFSAEDTKAAVRVAMCEQARLLNLVSKQKDLTYALGVLRAAERRADRDVPESLIRRRDDRLGLTIPAVSDQDCIPLARAGVLGDTIFPPWEEQR